MTKVELHLNGAPLGPEPSRLARGPELVEGLVAEGLPRSMRLRPTNQIGANPDRDRKHASVPPSTLLHNVGFVFRLSGAILLLRVTILLRLGNG